MSAELNAMLDAIAKLTQVITESQARAAVHPSGLGAQDRKKIDLRLIKVNDFQGNAEVWDLWAFSFKGGVRAKDRAAYKLLIQTGELGTDLDENGLNSTEETISGEIYNLLCQFCR